jgi:hypothetical protein
MRKAKMSFQSGQVKQVIRTYAVEVQTSDKKDLEAETVEMKLRKAMGANCEFIHDNGVGETVKERRWRLICVFANFWIDDRQTSGY